MAYSLAVRSDGIHPGALPGKLTGEHLCRSPVEVAQNIVEIKQIAVGDILSIGRLEDRCSQLWGIFSGGTTKKRCLDLLTPAREPDGREVKTIGRCTGIQSEHNDALFVEQTGK
jgi:hypothetical protein